MGYTAYFAVTSCHAPAANTKALRHVGVRLSPRLRLLDCRFVNCQAAKWQFRAGQMEQAEKTAAMFTKDGDQANNLHDMQCMWYEIECGRAHLQRHNLGKVRTLDHQTRQTTSGQTRVDVVFRFFQVENTQSKIDELYMEHGKTNVC